MMIIISCFKFQVIRYSSSDVLAKEIKFQTTPSSGEQTKKVSRDWVVFSHRSVTHGQLKQLANFIIFIKLRYRNCLAVA